MAQKDVGNKVPIYKLKTTEEVMNYYDEWGKNGKYDNDMVEWNYTGPQESVDVFRKYENNKENFDNIFSFKEIFKLSVINFAVPSAVFNATFPVKPSETITLTFPFINSFPSIYPEKL